MAISLIDGHQYQGEKHRPASSHSQTLSHLTILVFEGIKS